MLVDFSYYFLQKYPHEKMKHDGYEFLSQTTESDRYVWKILWIYVQ